jgi:hypothetical protein
VFIGWGIKNDTLFDLEILQKPETHVTLKAEPAVLVKGKL